MTRSEVMILGEMCVLSLIYIYVAVCMFRAVQYVVSLYASVCYFLTTRLMFYNIIFFVCFLFPILCFCIALCIVSPCVYSRLFPIFVQVYRPLSPVGNPIAINRYHVMSCHVMSINIS